MSAAEYFLMFSWALTKQKPSIGLIALMKNPFYVADRVAKLIEKTTVDRWYHVSIANKPMDAGTSDS